MIPPSTSFVIRVEHQSISKLTFVKFDDIRSAFDCKNSVDHAIRRLKAKEGVYGSDYVFSRYVLDHFTPENLYNLISVKELMGIIGPCCEQDKDSPYGWHSHGHWSGCKTKMTTLELGYNERLAAVSKAYAEAGFCYPTT